MYKKEVVKKYVYTNMGKQDVEVHEKDTITICGKTIGVMDNIDWLLKNGIVEVQEYMPKSVIDGVAEYLQKELLGDSIELRDIKRAIVAPYRVGILYGRRNLLRLLSDAEKQKTGYRVKAGTTASFVELVSLKPLYAISTDNYELSIMRSKCVFSPNVIKDVVELVKDIEQYIFPDNK